MKFPTTRLRRLRMNDKVRELIAEVDLTRTDLIYPLFIKEEDGPPKAIRSMPGIFQYSVGDVGRIAKEVQDLGIPGVMIFGVPAKKDPTGSEAYNPKGVVQRGITEIREHAPSLLAIADCCLCEYTEHGHCGPVKNNSPDNDLTLELLQKTASSQARAGAHIIAPSGMIDGMVAAIRTALDGEGLSDTLILSYSAKFASSFYGPFREASGVDSFKGERRTHQLDYRGYSQALLETRLDIEEGADMIMVKPALPYLDIIRRFKEEFDHPLAAYNISGEYAMIKAAAQLGWLDEKKAVIEVLTSIKRAGADMIITYFAKDIAELL